MSYEIPYDSNYGEWYGQPQDVTRLSAMLEQSLDEDGYPIGIITASWNMPDNGGTFVAQLSTDGTEYHIAETNIRQNSVILVVEPNTDYYLKIITVLGSQQSSGVVSSLLSSGVTIVPPTPTVVAVQGGMQINVGSVPFGYNAVISISDGTDTTVLYTTNMITIYNCDAGTYSVSTAYANASNDVGASSSSVSVTVSELATADDYVEKTSADYIKNASVNAGGDTLTLTKGDDSTVTFQGGGGGGGGSYTAGDGIDISNDTISLETASTTDKGGIIVGSGLSIDSNGVLSATGGGGGLSEQMYSNVLYENSSGTTTSGTITLLDSINNYDIICFISGGFWKGTNQYWVADIQKWLQDGGKSLILSSNNNGSALTSVLDLVDDTHFTFSSNSGARNNLGIKTVMGIKLAQGGYSGIVTDARMTVKSGTYTTTSNISSWTTIPIVFDSPMPDTNYVVSLNSQGGTTGASYFQVFPESKTVNGFQIDARGNGGTVSAGAKIDWLAIRPNSYTREGMVEDVLFSNASGVNSGTINLSGNISDYDLVSLYLSQGNNVAQGRYSQVFDASTLSYLASNSYYFNVLGYDGRYIKFGFNSDHSLYVDSHDNANPQLKLHQVVGIKFGRYVSGVAVDTTVTQNSSSVVTSGAVYDYIATLEARIQALESQLS